MADYLYAFQSSTSQPGFLRAPNLETRPQAPFVVAGVPWELADLRLRFRPSEDY
jgi:hypothetical protein